MQKKRLVIFFLLFIILTEFLSKYNVSASEAKIKYDVHLKDLGWINNFSAGEIGGTIGQSRRMEAIKISLENVDGLLTYQVHSQDYGWLGYVSEGELAGTTGECKRIEAIIIYLENSSYNIKYRVHVKDYGWLDWVSSGELAGTTGECRRIEAIQIILEKKTNNDLIAQENNIDNNDEDNILENLNNQENNNPNNSLENLNDQENNISSNGESNNLENLNNQEENTNNQQNNINNNNENNNLEELNNNSEEIHNLNNQQNIFFGIDISKHQGVIDWNKVKQSGVEFAMIRCGYRGYTAGGLNEDIQFINNVKGAYLNGIKIGLYFYSSAINEIEANEEANFVLGLINKYDIGNYISYPIVIDIEDFEGTRNYNLTVQQRTNVVKVFCNAIKNSGFKPMVYSYTYFLETKLNMDELNNYHTWIADYYGNTWYTRNYSIWQYTDKGKINGINGDVDLNYCYYNY